MKKILIAITLLFAFAAVAAEGDIVLSKEQARELGIAPGPTKGSVSFFWVKDPTGPTALTIGQKGTWKTDGFMPSAHPFYWSIDGASSIKGKTKFSYTFTTPGTHKLRVREGCPVFGESAHSDWSKTLVITVTAPGPTPTPTPDPTPTPTPTPVCPPCPPCTP